MDAPKFNVRDEVVVTFPDGSRIRGKIYPIPGAFLNEKGYLVLYEHTRFYIENGKRYFTSGARHPEYMITLFIENNDYYHLQLDDLE
jgi:hypothetical protein